MTYSHFPQDVYITDEMVNNELKKHNDYWNRCFTGKQKVQLMVDKIWEKYQELIDGSEIELCSAELHLSFTPEEQKEVLAILQNKRKSIEYKVEDREVTVETLDSLDSVGEPLTFYLEKLYLEEFSPCWNITEKSYDFAKRCKFFKIKVISGDDFREKSLDTESVKYKLEYDLDDRKLYINDVFIKKFQEKVGNERNLDFFFKHSNAETIRHEELPSHTKKPHDLINQFGIKNAKELKRAFFGIKGQTYHFRTTLSVSDIERLGIDEKTLEDEIRAFTNGTDK